MTDSAIEHTDTQPLLRAKIFGEAGLPDADPIGAKKHSNLQGN
jgi:hypothetical protein